MEKNYRAELTGVFGDPVDGNPTGVMEEAAYNALGLNYRYLTMCVKKENLKVAFEGAKAIGMKGLNLTMPHKIEIIPYLDELSKAALIIGAVNTVIHKDGKWVGENTDGKGFVISLEKEDISLEGKRVTLLGAGGAARAIAVECALSGASHIYIINRSPEHGEELAKLITANTTAQAEYLRWECNISIPAETDILIQATCIGLHPDSDQKPDINYDSITKNMTACDVIFNPVLPLFLKEASQRGAKAVTGIGMLVQQGALNFQLWTGKEAPTDIMYSALEQEFNV